MKDKLRKVEQKQERARLVPCGNCISGFVLYERVPRGRDGKPLYDGKPERCCRECECRLRWLGKLVEAEPQDRKTMAAGA